MIYVTGDTHGSIDIRKLLDNQVTKQMTEKDYLIICGDFGLIWNYKREDGKERKWLKWLGKRPWTTLFADGNHECFPRLNAFPVREWNGGKVHEIRPKILHLMRGEVFDIEGNIIYVMGGAASHDRGPAVGDTDRVIGKYWWPEEVPSEEEKEYGFENLKKYNYKVDYVITHCLPTSLQEIVKKGTYKPDPATDCLEEVYHRIRFKHWYCGHYHYNIDVNPKVSIVFSRIMKIGSAIHDSETMLGVPKYMRGDFVLFEYKGEPLMGKIKDVMPWGTLTKHEAPYYDITLLDPERKERVVTIMETQIIEKSLIESEEKMRIVFVIGPAFSGKSIYIRDHLPGATHVKISTFSQHVYQAETNDEIEQIAFNAQHYCAEDLKNRIRSAEKNETIVLEHQMLKKEDRQFFLAAVREVTDTPVECIVLSPTDEMVRHMLGNEQQLIIFYEYEKGKFEMPDEGEGFVSVRTVSPEAQ